MKKKVAKLHKLTPRLESELAASEIVKPVDEYVTRILHTVNPGDLIAAMGAVKKFHELTQRKVSVVQLFVLAGSVS